MLSTYLKSVLDPDAKYCLISLISYDTSVGAKILVSNKILAPDMLHPFFKSGLINMNLAQVTQRY